MSRIAAVATWVPALAFELPAIRCRYSCFAKADFPVVGLVRDVRLAVGGRPLHQASRGSTVAVPGREHRQLVRRLAALARTPRRRRPRSGHTPVRSRLLVGFRPACPASLRVAAPLPDREGMALAGELGTRAHAGGVLRVTHQLTKQSNRDTAETAAAL